MALSGLLNLPADPGAAGPSAAIRAGPFPFLVAPCNMADKRLASVVPLPIIADPDLSDNAKVVAAGIGCFMDASGSCHPGADKIAEITGKSLSSTYRGIQDLLDRKHLSRQRRARQSAVFTWLHPMIGQTWESKPRLDSHKKGVDSHSSENRKGSRFSPGEKTRTRTAFNENLNEGTARHTDGANSNSNSARRSGPSAPVPLRSLVDLFAAQVAAGKPERVEPS